MSCKAVVCFPNCSLCVYPEMMRDLVDFYNIATYTIVATSAGIILLYFDIFQATFV